LKILVFEYICGGGFAGQPLPPSLAAEGSMMLQALVDELKSLSAVELLIPLDYRCLHLLIPDQLEIVGIHPGQDIIRLLPELIARCDAVWPIAPESGAVLAGIAELVVAQNKTLLLSAPAAVALCSDKLATYKCLIAKQIPMPNTRLLKGFNYPGGLYIIKPIDGEGCQNTRLIENRDDFALALQAIDASEKYIIQPFYVGQSVSLSCLCRQGQAWLLCCNRQHIDINQKQLTLTGCTVNVTTPFQDYYQRLVAQVAAALPDLWGYIGIDLIETAEGPKLLEINPRLTTSYVGVRQATGINVAEQVLALLSATDPDLQQTGNREVEVIVYV